MKESIIGFVAGLLFAIGLGISGMVQPIKVVGFLDVFGQWDPTLLFVILGAVIVYAVGFHVVKNIRSESVLGQKFQIPTNQKLDHKLILGATIFGMGWGLVGYCPGPAIMSLPTGQWQPIVFVLAMVVGMAGNKGLQKILGG